MRSFILKSHVHTGHVEYLTHCFKVVVFFTPYFIHVSENWLSSTGKQQCVIAVCVYINERATQHAKRIQWI